MLIKRISTKLGGLILVAALWLCESQSMGQFILSRINFNPPKAVQQLLKEIADLEISPSSRLNFGMRRRNVATRRDQLGAQTSIGDFQNDRDGLASLLNSRCESDTERNPTQTFARRGLASANPIQAAWRAASQKGNKCRQNEPAVAKMLVDFERLVDRLKARETRSTVQGNALYSR